MTECETERATECVVVLVVRGGAGVGVQRETERLQIYQIHQRGNCRCPACRDMPSRRHLPRVPYLHFLAHARYHHLLTSTQTCVKDSSGRNLSGRPRPVPLLRGGGARSTPSNTSSSRMSEGDHGMSRQIRQSTKVSTDGRDRVCIFGNGNPDKFFDARTAG